MHVKHETCRQEGGEGIESLGVGLFVGARVHKFIIYTPLVAVDNSLYQVVLLCLLRAFRDLLRADKSTLPVDK